MRRYIINIGRIIRIIIKSDIKLLNVTIYTTTVDLSLFCGSKYEIDVDPLDISKSIMLVIDHSINRIIHVRPTDWLFSNSNCDFLIVFHEDEFNNIFEVASITH